MHGHLNANLSRCTVTWTSNSRSIFCQNRNDALITQVFISAFTRPLDWPRRRLRSWTLAAGQLINIACHNACCESIMIASYLTKLSAVWHVQSFPLCKTSSRRTLPNTERLRERVRIIIRRKWRARGSEPLLRLLLSTLQRLLLRTLSRS